MRIHLKDTKERPRCFEHFLFEAPALAIARVPTFFTGFTRGAPTFERGHCCNGYATFATPLCGCVKRNWKKKTVITGTIAFFERLRECVSRSLALERTQACGFNSLDCQMTPAPHAGTHKYAHNMCGSPPGSPDPERWKIPSVPHRSHNLS